MNTLRFVLVGLIATSMALLSMRAWAQPGNPPADQPAAKPADSGDKTPEVGNGGVYVVDSGQALQKIHQAERLARAGEWDQASQSLHEAYSKYRTMLLAVEPGQLYIGVGERINQLLSTWPAEGLAIYRKRYDGVARQAYQKAAASGDAIEMAIVARQFWVSSIGAQAADEAAEMALESGRFSAAIDLWARLAGRLEKSADAKTALPPVLAKLAVAYAWDNRPAEAAKIRARLAKDFPDHKDRFTGDAMTLAQWAAAFSKPPMVASDTEPDTITDTPIIGADATRTRINPSNLSFGAKIWSFEGHKPANGTVVQPPPAMYNPNGQPVDMAKLLAKSQQLIPVLAADTVFLAGPTGVFAISATSGKLLWTRPDIHIDSSQQNMYGMAVVQPILYSPTWWQGRLYVTYGVSTPRQMYMGAQPNGGGGGVVCLDGVTGKEQWRFSIDNVPGLAHGFVDSSPLVFGGRVYLVVHTGKSVFDEITLVAIDAFGSGNVDRVCWQQAISSADSGTGYISLRGPCTLAAAEGNTLYVATNLGTVAAVAAETGEIRWIRQYDRNNHSGDDPNPQNGFGAMRQPPPPPSEYAPTFVWNGRVIVLPADCDDLLVLDSSTGAVLSRVNRKKDLFEMTEPFGVTDGLLIGRGKEVVAWDLLAGKLAWHRELARPGEVVNPVSYRGQLTRQFLYLPTDKFLLRFDLATHDYPERFAWQPGASDNKGCDGAILLSNRMIITANATRVTGYCEWEQAERMDKVAISTADAGNRPDRILDYAGHAYMTRHLELAQEQIARAVAEAGGYESLTRPDLKGRVFNAALDVAAETAAQSQPDSVKRTLELLTMASCCPPDVDGHVRYRVELGKYWTVNKDLPLAVKYYQEILADPTMRAGVYHPNDQVKAEAGRLARESIDRLIAANGPDVYQAVAAQADRDFAQARERSDWNEIDQLVRQYPNAERTRKELFDLADHLAGRNDQDAAIGWLRYLRAEYPDSLDHHPAEDAVALTRMANYALQLRDQRLAATQPEERIRKSRANHELLRAYSFLRTACKTRNNGDTRVVIAGVEATFTQHRDDMKKNHPRELQMLPEVLAGLGAPRQLDLVGNMAQLLKAAVVSQSSSDDIALIKVMTAPMVWELRGYQFAKSDQPIWNLKFDNETGNSIRLVTRYDDLAVFGQLHRIKARKIETGELAWSQEMKGAQFFGAISNFARHESFLLAAQNEFCMVVDLADPNGKVVSEFKLADPVHGCLTMTDTLMCYINRNGQAKVCVADWRTGKLLTSVAVPNGDVQWVALAADNHAVVFGGQTTVTACDVQTGRQLWTVTGNPRMGVAVEPPPIRGDIIYVAELVTPENRWHLRARNVVKGDVVWDKTLSPEGVQFTGQPMHLTLQEDSVIAWGDSVLAMVDADTGEVTSLWLDRGEFVRDLLVAQDYLVAIVGPHPNMGMRRNTPTEVRLYDRTPGGGRMEQQVRLQGIQPYGMPVLAPASPGLVVQGNQNMAQIHVLQPAGAAKPK